MHPEQIVRDGLHAILTAALPDVEIFRNRTRPIGAQAGGKVLEILVSRETAAPFGGSGSPGHYERAIEIMLVGYVSHLTATEAADARADFRLAVEAAVLLTPASHAAFGGAVTDFHMTGTDLALDAGAFAGASFAISLVFQTNRSIAEFQSM